MMELIELLQENGSIRYRQEFLDTTGMIKQNYRSIITGCSSFKVKQIMKACQIYNINANWVFGLEENIYRKGVLKKLPVTKTLTSKTK